MGFYSSCWYILFFLFPLSLLVNFSFKLELCRSSIVLNSSLAQKSAQIRRIFTPYAFLVGSSQAFYLVRS